MVRAVDFVDQQHGLIGSAQGREHRPLDQELVAVDVDRLVAGLADRQHLARIVPLVERRRGVDAFVALQADEPPGEHAADGFCGLGLADARRAFEQQRLAERKREIGGGREAVIGEIERGAQRLLQRFRAIDADDGSARRHLVTASPAAWRRPARGSRAALFRA